MNSSIIYPDESFAIMKGCFNVYKLQWVGRFDHEKHRIKKDHGIPQSAWKREILPTKYTKRHESNFMFRLSNKGNKSLEMRNDEQNQRLAWKGNIFSKSKWVGRFDHEKRRNRDERKNKIENDEIPILSEHVNDG